ncbi:MAG: hypothetical protein ABWW65_04945 [Thermoprotei archaeon]
MPRYIVVKSNRVIGVYEDFAEAVEAVVEAGGGEIYRSELVMRISEEEAISLKDVLMPATLEPVEAPVSKSRTGEKVVVIDTGIDHEVARILANKLKGYRVVKIITPGTDIRGEEFEVYEAKSDRDVLDYLRELVDKGSRVYFITSNKKVYTHSQAYKGVKALYIESSKYPDPAKAGEEIARIISE